MSQTDRIERDLTAWFFETAGPRMPEYTDDLLAQAAGMRQRPAWTFPERWLPMSVTTLGQRIQRPVPWRSIGLLALLGLIILLALAAYVGANRRPLPAPFGVAANGVLAFEDHGDIVAVDPVTGSRTVVISGPAAENAPVYSRDGTRLAFVRESGGVRSLWVADADGANQHRLATDDLVDFDGSAWSPDGRSIVTSSAVDGLSTITVLPTDGGAAHSLAVGMSAEGPIWRPPDGAEILFRGTTATGVHGLFAVAPDGSGVRPVSPTDGRQEFDYLYYDWSPDGRQVVYQWIELATPCDGGVCGQHLYIGAADGTGRRQITTVESIAPQWSPDGRSIMFWDNDAGGPVIGVVLIDQAGPVIQTGPIGPVAGIAWTPDGADILYLPDGTDVPMLLDPYGGAPAVVPWRTSAFPSWQRLALP